MLHSLNIKTHIFYLNGTRLKYWEILHNLMVITTPKSPPKSLNPTYNNGHSTDLNYVLMALSHPNHACGHPYPSHT